MIKARNTFIFDVSDEPSSQHLFIIIGKYNNNWRIISNKWQINTINNRLRTSTNQSLLLAEPSLLSSSPRCDWETDSGNSCGLGSGPSTADAGQITRGHHHYFSLLCYCCMLIANQSRQEISRLCQQLIKDSPFLVAFPGSGYMACNVLICFFSLILLSFKL